jgi:16S rRNA (guanine527-N7)-methyltransferase
MKNILIRSALEYGLQLTDDDIASFRLYHDFLEEKNRVMNLTAIAGAKDVAELHFLDSLALLTLTGFTGKSVIDVGSGAGFPGIPMKLAEKSIILTLLDAQQKRVGFMEELCRALALHDVRCVHARAEEAALTAAYRDSFDTAVSRAVATLNILGELCLPFVKPGGVFIAMKGTDSDGEISAAENAFHVLGAELEKVTDYRIPGTDITHRAVLVRKKSPTPEGYPRRYAKIEKKPL